MPWVARNQAPNGTRNGSACGLVIRLTASSAAVTSGRPRTRREQRQDRAQHVDRLVLAPPRRHVPRGRPEQHGAAASSASFGRSRNHQITAAAMPRSASVAGTFISERIPGSDESVTVRNAGSRAARPPQIHAMTGGEAEVLVVGAVPAVDRDPVDPEDELVDVADEPAALEHRDRRIDDAGDEQDGDREQQPGRPARTVLEVAGPGEAAGRSACRAAVRRIRNGS